MDHKAIFKLIAACKKAGIKEFKQGDLCFTFHQEQQAWPEAPKNTEIREIDEQDKIALEEAKMNQLLLENPSEYEALMAEKILNN